MWNWLREFYAVRTAYKQSQEKPCPSCEVLKVQLERANYEREHLINRLLLPPVQPPETKPIPVTQPQSGRHIPFRVKQQLLEAESREEARILRKHKEDMEKAAVASVISKPADSSHIDQIITSPQVEELERELGIK